MNANRFALVLVAAAGCYGRWSPPRQIREDHPQLMITTRATPAYWGSGSHNDCTRLKQANELLTCTPMVPPDAKWRQFPEGYVVEVLEYPVSWTDHDLTAQCKGLARVRGRLGMGSMLVAFGDLAPPDPAKLRQTRYVDSTEGATAHVVASGEEVKLAYGEPVRRAACGDSLVVDREGRLLYNPRLFLTDKPPDPAYPVWQKTCDTVANRLDQAPLLPNPVALAASPHPDATLYRFVILDLDGALVSHTPGDYQYLVQTTGGAFLLHAKLPLVSRGYIGSHRRDLLVRVTGKIRDLKLVKAVEIVAEASRFPCFYDPAVFGVPDLKSDEGQ
jgi:hypothetical protein